MGRSLESPDESSARSTTGPGREGRAAWSRAGDALARLGRSAEALAAYDEALRLEPEDPEVWGRKGISLARLGRREEAVHWLYRAWTARERLSDRGRSAAGLLTALGIVLADCEDCAKRDSDQ